MRKLLALAFAVVLAFSTVGTAAVSSFGRKAHDASVVIMRPDKDGAVSSYCSGTSIVSPDGVACILTARHCVINMKTNEVFDDEVVTFADDQGGPYYVVEVEAIAPDEDLALLRVMNPGKIPAIKLGDEKKMQPGDALFVWSYPRGVGKIYTVGTFVAPKFPADEDTLWLTRAGWQNAMPIQDTISYGSSGSGIFSDDQQALIGVTVGFIPPDFNIKIAMPVSRVKYMLAHLKEDSADNWRKAHGPKV